MCVNQSYVFNKYTGEKVYTSCYNCPSCQQSRADFRYSKIQNHIKGQDYFTIFLTLTYSNDFLPVFYASDCFNPDKPLELDHDGFYQIPIYRLMSYSVRPNRNGGTTKVIKPSSLPIDYFPVSEKEYSRFFTPDILNGCTSPVNYPCFDAIGVSYSADWTNFVKRLNSNLFRYYGIPRQTFSYYRVSEYGPETLRPHFHALLFFPKKYLAMYSQIRRSIVASWPFCNPDRLYGKGIQIARNAASYLSKYVNRGSNFPPFLSVLSIRPKASSSNFFGFGNSEFSLPSLLEKIDKRSLFYTYHSVDKEGRPFSRDVLLPAYVIHRYFPKFKGMRLLSFLQIYDFICAPSFAYLYKTPVWHLIDYTYDDFLSAAKGFRRGFNRFLECFPGSSIYDYAIYYVKCHSLYFSTLMRMSFNDIVSYSDYYHHYYNFADYLDGKVRSDIRIDSNVTHDFVDYNKSPVVIVRTRELTNKYNENMKTRHFNDCIDSTDESQYIYRCSLNKLI